MVNDIYYQVVDQTIPVDEDDGLDSSGGDVLNAVVGSPQLSVLNDDDVDSSQDKSVVLPLFGSHVSYPNNAIGR